MLKKSMKMMVGIVVVFAMVYSSTLVRSNVSYAAVKVKKITLNRTKLSMYVGEKVTIKVKKVTPKKSNKEVIYKTNKKSVAIVSKKGVVTAKSKGSAKISVISKSNKKIKKVVKVTVMDKPKEQISQNVQNNNSGKNAQNTLEMNNVHSDNNKPVEADTPNDNEATPVPGYIEDGKLILHYSDSNAEEVIGQIKSSDIPVCVIVDEGVTSIGDETFKGCSSLTNIEISGSVTSIECAAFYDCSSLIDIEIPDSVTSIGEYAFFDCSSLTNIEIPDSVTSIGHLAFKGCSSLTNIEIPGSVTSIEYSVFRDCNSLTSIRVANNNPVYDSRGNCNAIIEIESNILVAGCKSTKIPNSVTSIEYAAFYDCSSLTDIEIPNSVTSIGYEAFKGCSSLTSIEIPESVMRIGECAFEGCSNLTSILWQGNTYNSVDEFWNTFLHVKYPDLY